MNIIYVNKITPTEKINIFNKNFFLQINNGIHFNTLHQVYRKKLENDNNKSNTGRLNMIPIFQELDNRDTSIGQLSLRRRRDLSLDGEIYEIKLGDEYLMSSMFTESEVALGRLGIQEHPGDHLDVVVGGLGLGYTARAVLESGRTGSLLVVEALQAVIDWHNEGLLPLGPELTGDHRCGFVHGDFFAAAASSEGFDPEQPYRRFDAILVDIDHSPDMWLDPGNAAFYQPGGLKKLKQHMKPGGVFSLWSNDPPDNVFASRLKDVFGTARGEPITFMNPLQKKEYTQSVYLAQMTAL
jgi:spermidine synthase